MIEVTCPQCKTRHNRGAINGWRSYRCLNCGNLWNDRPVNSKDTKGCGYEGGCSASGWWVSTNDVPYGDTFVCESFMGECSQHGEYEGQHTSEGCIVRWWNDIEEALKQDATYYGYASVEEFQKFGKIPLGESHEIFRMSSLSKIQ